MFYITAINKKGERFTKSYDNYLTWQKQIAKIRKSKVLTFCGAFKD